MADDKPTFRTIDWAAQVRATDGRKPQYRPTYEFSGRTFKERDLPGPKPSDHDGS